MTSSKRNLLIRNLLILFVVLPSLVYACTKDQNTSENVSKTEETEPVKKEYSLNLNAKEISPNKIKLEVGSNIPGKIEVMASIDLANQAPNDIYIGKSEKMMMATQNASKIIDVSDLPSGDYIAEVTLYPIWGFKDSKSKSAGIKSEISATQSIAIRGSGESSDLVKDKNEGQQWVMLNIEMGTAWDPNWWKNRFGDWVQIPTAKRNPEIIKNYYFESLDMTIVVNTLKEQIATYRIGKVGL